MLTYYEEICEYVVRGSRLGRIHRVGQDRLVGSILKKAHGTSFRILNSATGPKEQDYLITSVCACIYSSFYRSCLLLSLCCCLQIQRTCLGCGSYLCGLPQSTLVWHVRSTQGIRSCILFREQSSGQPDQSINSSHSSWKLVAI